MRDDMDVAMEEIMKREAEKTEWMKRAIRAESDLKFELKMREFFEKRSNEYWDELQKLRLQIVDLGGNPDE